MSPKYENEQLIDQNNLVEDENALSPKAEDEQKLNNDHPELKSDTKVNVQKIKVSFHQFN